MTSSEPSSTTWIWWWESSIFTTEMYTATTTTTTILGNYGSHGDSGNTDSPKMSTPFSSLSSVRSSTEPSKTTLSSQNEHAVNKFIGDYSLFEKLLLQNVFKTNDGGGQELNLHSYFCLLILNSRQWTSENSKGLYSRYFWREISSFMVTYDILWSKYCLELRRNP